MKKIPFKILNRAWIFFAPLFAILLAADQFSKIWAETAMKSISAYDPVSQSTKDFGLSLVHNHGMVFGLDIPLEIIYAVTGFLFFLAAYLVIKNKLWRDHLHLIGLALFFSGALGNLIDRVRLGYVIDFIKIYWWPTFNLADVFIVTAVILFAWQFLVREEEISRI